MEMARGRNDSGRRERLSATLRDGREFVHDVLWLIGWGSRSLFGAARDRANSSQPQQRAGVLGSLAAVTFVGLLLKRRRGS